MVGPGAAGPWPDGARGQKDEKAMKVLKEALKGLSPGTPVPLAALGLPVKGTDGALIVFWKEQ